MAEDEVEQRISWRELAAAAVIGFLAGYGAVALVSHFVVGFRLTVGNLPPHPCGFGVRHPPQPLITAAQLPSWALKRSAGFYHPTSKGAPLSAGGTCVSRHIRVGLRLSVCLSRTGQGCKLSRACAV